MGSSQADRRAALAHGVKVLGPGGASVRTQHPSARSPPGQAAHRLLPRPLQGGPCTEEEEVPVPLVCPICPGGRRWLIKPLPAVPRRAPATAPALSGSLSCTPFPLRATCLAQDPVQCLPWGFAATVGLKPRTRAVLAAAGEWSQHGTELRDEGLCLLRAVDYTPRSRGAPGLVPPGLRRHRSQ